MEKQLILEIITELQQRQEDFKNPGSYMEDEWYVKCQAKAEAFEEAILIIKFLANIK